MTSLCLNMIVRNEVKILERCLSSVAPWIDAYVVGDTGSTDGTQDLIRDFFASRGIPGEIHEFEFLDFGHARNRALQHCRESALKFDTILLSDADMELVVEKESFRSDIDRPAHHVRQVAGISYDNVRILNRDLDARYVGRTHEYIDTRGAIPSRLEGIWFLDHAEGSSRGDKFERDVRLLKKSIEENPRDARAMFYLAQTYKDMGECHRAIEWYERRVKQGGFEEEVWYSLLMIARLHQKLGQDERFVAKSLEAFQRRPSRAEPLHDLANHYRHKGANELAAMFAEAGLDLPKSRDQLFIEDYIHDYGFRQEMAIAGYYSASSDRKARARDACMGLAIDRSAPDDVRNLARRNSLFFTRSACEMFPSFRAVPIECADAPEGYSPLNPSVAKNDGGLACVLRLSNFAALTDGRYISRATDGIVRTENRWLALDAKDLSTRSAHPIQDRSVRDDSVGDHHRVRGYEDLRLFQARGRWWASATVCDRQPGESRCEIAILELSKAGTDMAIERVHLQRSYEAHLHQKNWVPLVENDAIFFLYSVDPTILLRLDWETMQCVEIDRTEPSAALDHLRGGSQAIAVDGEKRWLFVTHEVIANEGQKRIYLHRFALFQAGEVTMVSDPFYFLERGIEFCAGMARGEGSQVVLSFGSDDQRACLASVDLAEIMSALKPTGG